MGFEDSHVASLWTRLGAFLYEHGESVYNFQGLRAYKDKFSALVAGGNQNIFRK